MNEERKNQQAAAEPSLSEILQVRRDKLKALQDAGRDPFTQTRFARSAYSTDIKNDFDAYDGKTLQAAGRIMSKRGMGKAIFCDIQDDRGQIQLYVRKDAVTEQEFADFRKYDIGDIIGVSGYAFKTKTGEISIHVQQVTLLSKSLRPLPEKFHGMTNTELRYRQRYVDLIMNPESKRNFQIRSRFVAYLRRYLDGLGFMEVETPVLSPIAGGATARPFITHHNTLDIDMYMRIATELHLKRLIVGGIERVYEVGRIFRNEGMDTKHNPEFTTIELYQAYTDFHGMMELVEDMMKTVAQKVCGSLVIPYQGHQIDLGNWQRLTMVEAVKKYSGVDYYDWKSDEDAIACAKAHNVELPEVPTKGAILAEFFDAFVEEKLIQPTFIYDYPVEISPLAKRKPDDPAFTERFEYFINATEFGNAFSELNDPIDQRGRFERQVAERRAQEPDTRAQVDYDFINALEYGMPPTGGLGFGVDRLVMLLTDSGSIRDVLLFPTMKSLDADKKAPKEAAAPAEETQAAPEAEETIDFSNVQIEPLFQDTIDFETFSKSDFRAVKVKECEAVKKSKKLLKFVLDDGSGTDRVILSGIHEYYEPEELVGKTCIAITNLPPRAMMGIDSCGMLISAVHHENGEEKLHLLMVDPHIPAGAKLY